MIRKRGKYLVLILTFIITISITNAITDTLPQDTNLQIVGFSKKISPAERHGIFINESEFYKNKKRTFEVGLPSNSFTPEPRKDLSSINHFKSLNRKWPYHAAVINILDIVRRITVRIKRDSEYLLCR